MSEHIFLLTIGLPLATVLLIFGMKYLAQIQQARARLAGDEAMRRLAAIDASLTDVKTRLAAVEKILREVE